MFDIAWSEMAILGVLALVFIGPKDLPVFLRTFGRYAGSIKRQIGDFRAQLDAVMDEVHLEPKRTDIAPRRTIAEAEPFESNGAFDAAVRAAGREPAVGPGSA